MELRQIILFCAWAVVGFMAFSVAYATLQSGQKLSAMLAPSRVVEPTLARAAFLLANVGLAVTFLVSVLNANWQAPTPPDISTLFGGVDLSAFSGLASASFLWGKLRSQ